MMLKVIALALWIVAVLALIMVFAICQEVFTDDRAILCAFVAACTALGGGVIWGLQKWSKA